MMYKLCIRYDFGTVSSSFPYVLRQPNIVLAKQKKGQIILLHYDLKNLLISY